MQYIIHQSTKEQLQLQLFSDFSSYQVKTHVGHATSLENCCGRFAIQLTQNCCAPWKWKCYEIRC